jgi:hypothetical protein
MPIHQLQKHNQIFLQSAIKKKKEKKKAKNAPVTNTTIQLSEKP